MRAGRFYGGVALLTFSTLMLEILETRLLSVIAWYHLAFFVISAAMFGMTAGAIWVHRGGERFTPATLPHDLSRLTRGFALTAAMSVAFQCTLGAAQVASVTLVVVYLELALAMAVPFFMSGAAVSLALTRSPFPIGRVYAADLAGAAMGCLGVLVILRFADAVSAIVLTGALAALAAAWFELPHPAPPARREPVWLRPVPLASLLLLLGFANARTGHGLQPVVVKDQTELRHRSYAYEKWNSYSRVIAMQPVEDTPYYWGASRFAPIAPARQIWMNIDGDAATVMVAFHGDTAGVGFLHYDVTNLAYAVRSAGRAVVLGVGSGRDVLSAWTAGMRDITGVELNPIFVDLLTRREPFRSFAGLAELPHVRFLVDDARSWAARRPGTYDVVEMSMVDTFAATGAGAFSLSENGLYTVHSWRNFIALLSPQGVFTVSRWYAPGLVNETGRLLSLATAALLESGIRAPERHLFVAATGRVATMLLFRSEVTAADRGKLEQFCALRGYQVLLSPGHASPSPLLQGIVSSRSAAELRARTSGLPLDLTPPTDDRPFFFNVLPLLRPLGALRFLGDSAGMLRGNVVATITLLIILVVSLALVVATIVLPLRPAIRQVGRSLVIGGTAYFALLGFGFMCVEMGLLQRCSLFLGHPVYSLSVVLFSLILSTGLGSWLTELWRLDTPRRFLAWSLPLAVYLASLPFWLASTFESFEQADVLVRCVLAAAVVAPAGVLMGFGFPTGMALASAHDARPTAWFWGVNGAAGVLASVLAVAVSIVAGVHVTLWIGAACYLLLILPAARIGFPAVRNRATAA